MGHRIRQARGNPVMRGHRRIGLSAAAAVAVALVVSGCDRSQSLADAPKKSDAQAWSGPGNGAAHSAVGFKAGDKAAWEAQLKARTERGQNEYARTTAGAK